PHSSLVFFFQAEDGIRDGHVTGVQTCALPISDRIGPAMTPANPAKPAPNANSSALRKAMFTPSAPTMPGLDAPARISMPSRVPRSEERRVGKECRSGWWADH